MNLKGASRGLPYFAVALVVAAAFVVCISATFAFDDVAVSSLTFTPSYRAMTVSWDYSSAEDTSTAFYVLYRADDKNGGGAHRIAVLSGGRTSYIDAGLFPGSKYSYALKFGTSHDGLDDIDTSTLAWSDLQEVPLIGGTDAQGAAVVSPHVRYQGTSANPKNSCPTCHVVHQASATSTQLLATSADITEPNSKIAVCEICHLNTSASEKDFVTSILTTATAGHTVLNAQNSTGVLECTTCHGAHVGGEGTQGALLFSTVKAFGTLTSDLSVDETGFNPQCTTCHDNDTTWFNAVETTSYPSVKDPVRVADVTISSGYFDYPKLGTFPGLSIVASSTQNAHALIADKGDYNKGDCRYCHNSHNSASPYSQLLTQRGELRAMVSTEETVTQEEKTSGAYASFCLSCHNGSNSGQPWSKAFDIADVVSLPPGSTEASRTAFLQSNAGHRVESANADVPSGSALPCYGCHNPHGSKYGNTYNLSDSLGTSLRDTRDICLTCHVTSDGFACTDGDENLVAYSDTSVRKTIFGLSRSGIDSVEGTATATNMLKLDDSIASHASTGELDCDNPSCHGNVHSPTNSR